MPPKKKAAPPLTAQQQEAKHAKSNKKKEKSDNFHAGEMFRLAVRAARTAAAISTEEPVIVTKPAPSASKDAKAEDLPEIDGKSSVGIVQVKEMMRMFRGMTKVLRAVMWFGGSSVSAAATAQAPVHNVRPSSSTEFSSAAAMFDEYKAHAVKYRFRIEINVGPSVSIDAAVAYDPANNGVYGTLLAVLPARICKQVTVPASYGTPAAHTQDALWEMSFTLPKGATADPTAANAVNTGVWTDTSLTAIDYGFMKWFVTPASATVTTTIHYWFGVDTEFRMRS